MFSRLCFKYLTNIAPIPAPNPPAWLQARHKGALWGRAWGEGGWGAPALGGRSGCAKVTQPFGSPGLGAGWGAGDGDKVLGVLIFFPEVKLENGGSGSERNRFRIKPVKEVSAERRVGAARTGPGRERAVRAVQGRHSRSQTLGFLSGHRGTYLESARH